MIKEKIDNMKNAIIKSEKNGKKKSIENLLVLAVILIVTVIAINYIWNGKGTKSKDTNNAKVLAEEQINESTTTAKYNRR